MFFSLRYKPRNMTVVKTNKALQLEEALSFMTSNISFELLQGDTCEFWSYHRYIINYLNRAIAWNVVTIVVVYNYKEIPHMKRRFTWIFS